MKLPLGLERERGLRGVRLAQQITLFPRFQTVSSQPQPSHFFTHASAPFSGNKWGASYAADTMQDLVPTTNRSQGAFHQGLPFTNLCNASVFELAKDFSG